MSLSPVSGRLRRETDVKNDRAGQVGRLGNATSRHIEVSPPLLARRPRQGAILPVVPLVVDQHQASDALTLDRVELDREFGGRRPGLRHACRGQEANALASFRLFSIGLA